MLPALHFLSHNSTHVIVIHLNMLSQWCIFMVFSLWFSLTFRLHFEIRAAISLVSSQRPYQEAATLKSTSVELFDDSICYTPRYFYKIRK